MKQRVAYMDMRDIIPVAVLFVVAGVVIAYGVSITDDIGDDLGSKYCALRTDAVTSYNETSGLCYNATGATVEPGTEGFNATQNTMVAENNLSKRLPVLATILILGVIIGVLVRNLAVR